MSRKPALIPSVLILCLAAACSGKLESPISPTAAVATSGCQLTIDPASQSTPTTGGLFYTAVAGPCPWNAATTDSWITVTYGQGSGVGSVAYSVAPNTGGSARQGSVRIGEQVLVVSQPGLDCRASLEPPARSVPPEGGTYDFNVVIDPQCTWSASANESWVSLRSSGGTGPQTVQFTVAANTNGVERNASIRVADREVSIRQAAPPPPPPPPPPSTSTCSYTLSPATQNVTWEGGNFSVGITTGQGCAWSAAASVEWIAIESGTGSGMGSGRVAYVVRPTSGPGRSAQIRIGDASLTVSQAGLP